MPIDTEAIINKYDKEKYRLLASTIKEILSPILQKKAIRPHSITYRAKDLKSLKKKIEEKKYKDLREITDLAGVRVITYYPSDVDPIVREIEENFVIDKEKSIDKRKNSDLSIFGYASVHLIVDLSADRLNLPEYSSYKDMTCEIQVRTILQHAWAEIEHDIVYKSTEEIPFDLRRNFSSLAGLLEVADREFELIRNMKKEVSRKIENKINIESLDIPIDFESISFYLKKYHNVNINEQNNVQHTRDLIKFLKSKNINTVRELDQILTPERLSTADGYLKTKCKGSNRCVLRYFLAVGYSFNYTISEISELSGCTEIGLSV
ncbi:MAG: GTP pyrophosphokinase [Candidatus Methanoperedenaceae archaeon]|nr:MAG: GTP pyrophosphokinase [Candidatus Methanoperedenaceae archaeon]